MFHGFRCFCMFLLKTLLLAPSPRKSTLVKTVVFITFNSSQEQDLMTAIRRGLEAPTYGAFTGTSWLFLLFPHGVASFCCFCSFLLF